jgi:peptide/nickel transport system permease protein
VWLLSRLGGFVAVVWLASTLSFFALRAVPGDAIQSQLVISGASEVVIAERRAALGLDNPLPTQYLGFLTGLVRGDLGTSLIDGQPVTDILLRALPPTLALAGSAFIVAVVLGLALGIATALELRLISLLARLILNLSLSIPIYWTGTLAIYLFAARLNWLPSGGAGGIDALVLPALALGFHAAGAIARVTQAGVRGTMAAPFIGTARAKGLPERIVVLRHALRHALPPVVSVSALQAGFLLGGVVITESLFARPGIGRVLLDAALNQNYPVVQGAVIWAALAYTFTNAVAELLTGIIDPRTRAEMA